LCGGFSYEIDVALSKPNIPGTVAMTVALRSKKTSTGSHRAVRLVIANKPWVISPFPEIIKWPKLVRSADNVRSTSYSSERIYFSTQLGPTPNRSKSALKKSRETHCQLVNPPPSDAVRKQKKNVLEDLISTVLSQLKKYHPPGNLKFNYLGIFKSLKKRISTEKKLSISLKRNFTPHTLG